MTTGKIMIALLGLAAISCTPTTMRALDPEHNDFHDRHLGLSRNDFRNLDKPDAPEGEMPPGGKDIDQDMRKSGRAHVKGGITPDLGTGEEAKDITTKIETKAPPIPTLAQILAAPQPPKIGETQLVSIAVTDDVPLKDVLIELGRLANIDIELDAGIAGGISFTANNRPFNEVISRISDLAGLRYTMKNGVLRVERDQPYIRNYSLDFLNLVRNSDSSVNISTNVLSGGGGGSSGGSSGGGGGGGINTGSTTAITSKSDSDLWSSMEGGIKEILSYAPARHVSQLANTVTEVDLARADGSASGAAGGSIGSSSLAGQSLPPSVGASAPTSSASTGASATAGGSSGLGSGSGHGSVDTFYIMNRQAGMLTVSANDKQQQLITTFLDKMRSNASAQVLIEAKIVEITLDERYQSGIQWSVLGHKYGVNFTGSTLGASDTNTSNTATSINLGRGTDLNNLINLIEEFGTTRTLSSPRLSAINNQQAVLTFARNQVYFHLTVEQGTTTSVGNIASNTPPTVTSEVKTVPIGLILTMQPSISLESNEVTLNVRPTLSRLAGTVPDPAAAYLASTISSSNSKTASLLQNNVPIVEVRELDSILKLKSGEVMVIGGLMEQGGSNRDAGIPFADEVPWFGNLFKNTTKTNTSTELVIFIRATIVDSNGQSHPADQKIYDKFTRDPRPLVF